ncbi:zinc finger BED domain-containing protein 4-like [Sitophilus oryzae]|uniref:Zinc finger BED domain-containing protein 4-like n=1 Tax=Sitophilus oryzae TaxID=7048 RepID=A0A6J2YHT3_SITOR|nr:zinc finger BED domain-containing protein 4-like [Sitophilus oryzae]
MLNLIVTDGLEDKNNRLLSDLIDLVKSFVTFGRRSNNFMDALRAEQQKDNVPEGGVALFIQSVPTRWNSTFDMLSRFINLYPYVARVLANPNLKLKNAPRMLSGDEIDLLSEIVEILKPFKQATTEISGSDYLTGSLVLPMISCIESALSTIKPTSEMSKILLKKLEDSLGIRCAPTQTNPLLCNAVLCDPRFKRLYMKPVVASQAVMQIKEEIKKEQKELGNCSPPTPSSSPRRQEDPMSLWSMHDKSLEKSGMASTEVESYFPSELKLYLQQPVLHRMQDPIQFWHQSKTLMTALSSIAMKYLTVVGSSVASERLVSTLNSIVKDDRSRLTDRHVTERVFMYRCSKSFWVD